MRRTIWHTSAMVKSQQSASLAVAVNTPSRAITFAPLAVGDWDNLNDRFRNSNKAVLFLTIEEDVFQHFNKQIDHLLQREGCFSWTNALSDEQFEPDWDSIHFLVVAENLEAAMRTKLVTVELFLECFNERSATYTPLLDGRDEYVQAVQAIGFEMSDEAWAKLLRDVRTHNNPEIIEEMEEVDLLTCKSSRFYLILFV